MGAEPAGRRPGLRNVDAFEKAAVEAIRMTLYQHELDVSTGITLIRGRGPVCQPEGNPGRTTALPGTTDSDRHRWTTTFRRPAWS